MSISELEKYLSDLQAQVGYHQGQHLMAQGALQFCQMLLAKAQEAEKEPHEVKDA